MKKSSVTPIEVLASLLQSPDGHLFELLKKGLLAERERLGEKRYLTTLWLSDLGYDGCTDSISLGGSYIDGEDAINEANRWVHDITNKYLLWREGFTITSTSAPESLAHFTGRSWIDRCWAVSQNPGKSYALIF